LASLAAECSDAASGLRAWMETLETDPGTLEALRERKGLIGALKRKYGATVAEIIAAGEQARTRLEQLEGAGARLEQLEADLARARDEAHGLAADLSKRRMRAARQLSKLVAAELPVLALPNAVFEAVVAPTKQLTDSGGDHVEFRFSAARRRQPDLIGKIASGGELSRAMIAVTLSLAQTHAVPVLVFDEADQGVGGEAALEVARRLARLGAGHQVLVVTHLPQIAAFADRHISVRRRGEVIDVDILEGAGRIAEISRMLAGLEGSHLARAHADELLEVARTDKDASAATLAG
jgi:DNA repair protein RecN (Recombination protein N)